MSRSMRVGAQPYAEYGCPSGKVRPASLIAPRRTPPGGANVFKSWLAAEQPSAEDEAYVLREAGPSEVFKRWLELTASTSTEETAPAPASPEAKLDSTNGNTGTLWDVLEASDDPLASVRSDDAVLEADMEVGEVGDLKRRLLHEKARRELAEKTAERLREKVANSEKSIEKAVEKAVKQTIQVHEAAFRKQREVLERKLAAATSSSQPAAAELAACRREVVELRELLADREAAFLKKRDLLELTAAELAQELLAVRVPESSPAGAAQDAFELAACRQELAELRQLLAEYRGRENLELSAAFSSPLQDHVAALERQLEELKDNREAVDAILDKERAATHEELLLERSKRQEADARATLFEPLMVTLSERAASFEVQAVLAEKRVLSEEARAQQLEAELAACRRQHAGAQEQAQFCERDRKLLREQLEDVEVAAEEAAANIQRNQDSQYERLEARLAEREKDDRETLRELSAAAEQSRLQKEQAEMIAESLEVRMAEQLAMQAMRTEDFEGRIANIMLERKSLYDGIAERSEENEAIAEERASVAVVEARLQRRLEDDLAAVQQELSASAAQAQDLEGKLADSAKDVLQKELAAEALAADLNRAEIQQQLLNQRLQEHFQERDKELEAFAQLRAEKEGLHEELLTTKAKLAACKETGAQLMAVRVELASSRVRASAELEAQRCTLENTREGLQTELARAEAEDAQRQVVWALRFSEAEEAKIEDLNATLASLQQEFSSTREGLMAQLGAVEAKAEVFECQVAAEAETRQIVMHQLAACEMKLSESESQVESSVAVHERRLRVQEVEVTAAAKAQSFAREQAFFFQQMGVLPGFAAESTSAEQSLLSSSGSPVGGRGREIGSESTVREIGGTAPSSTAQTPSPRFRAVGSTGPPRSLRSSGVSSLPVSQDQGPEVDTESRRCIARVLTRTTLEVPANASGQIRTPSYPSNVPSSLGPPRHMPARASSPPRMSNTPLPQPQARTRPTSLSPMRTQTYSPPRSLSPMRSTQTRTPSPTPWGGVSSAPWVPGETCPVKARLGQSQQAGYAQRPSLLVSLNTSAPWPKAGQSLEIPAASSFVAAAGYAQQPSSPMSLNAPALCSTSGSSPLAQSRSLDAPVLRPKAGSSPLTQSRSLNAPVLWPTAGSSPLTQSFRLDAAVPLPKAGSSPLTQSFRSDALVPWPKAGSSPLAQSRSSSLDAPVSRPKAGPNALEQSRSLVAVKMADLHRDLRPLSALKVKSVTCSRE